MRGARYVVVDGATNLPLRWGDCSLTDVELQAQNPGEIAVLRADDLADWAADYLYDPLTGQLADPGA